MATKKEKRKDKKGRVLEKGESQRKNGSYVYQYRNSAGERKSAYAPTLSELRKKEKAINRDLEDCINTVGAEITLNKQFDRYMRIKSQNLKNATVENYHRLWDRHVRGCWLGEKRICDIKKSDILKFYASLSKEGLKNSTIKKFQGMISPCFNLAVDDDLIRKNPCRGCLRDFGDDTAERTPLTVAEQEELMRFVSENKVYAIYYPMLTVMLGTAIRCGELMGLTWDDIDFKNNEISINHQLIYKKNNGKYRFYISTPKTNSGVRVIPMTRDVRQALLRQREIQRASGRQTIVSIDGYHNFVFSTKTQVPLMPSGINRSLINIVNRHNSMADKRMELPHISAHTLRHTGCTRMAEAGMDPKVLQYIMGHSKIKITMDVYNHASSERNHKEMHKMDKIRSIA